MRQIKIGLGNASDYWELKHTFETHFYFLWWATICVLGGILYVAVQHL